MTLLATTSLSFPVCIIVYTFLDKYVTYLIIRTRTLQPTREPVISTKVESLERIVYCLHLILKWVEIVPSKFPRIVKMKKEVVSLLTCSFPKVVQRIFIVNYEVLGVLVGHDCSDLPMPLH